MPHKQVTFHSAAREKILRGASLLADAVRVTLGPKSKSVLIQKSWGTPIVCNDGVTIAKEFDLKDPEENLGAQVLRQAAEKTGDVVGDGTSTSTILAHAILADGIRNVVAGASAIDLKRGLDRAMRAPRSAACDGEGWKPFWRSPPSCCAIATLIEYRSLFGPAAEWRYSHRTQVDHQQAIGRGREQAQSRQRAARVCRKQGRKVSRSF